MTALVVLTSVNLMVSCVLYYLAIQRLAKWLKIISEALRLLTPWLDEEKVRQAGRSW
jgi:hypothetical protein